MTKKEELELTIAEMERLDNIGISCVADQNRYNELKERAILLEKEIKGNDLQKEKI